MGTSPPTHSNPRPIEAFNAEMAWLARNSSSYAGQWVALKGGHVIAHGPRLATVTAHARAAGIEDPFIASIPADTEPFGGW